MVGNDKINLICFYLLFNEKLDKRQTCNAFGHRQLSGSFTSTSVPLSRLSSNMLLSVVEGHIFTSESSARN